MADKKESKKDNKKELKKESKKSIKVSMDLKYVHKKGASRKSDGGESFGDKVWEAFAKPNTPKGAASVIALAKTNGDKKKAEKIQSKVLQKVLAKVIYHVRGERIIEA